MRKTAARSEFAAKSLVRTCLNGRAPGILRRAAVWAGEKRLGARKCPALDTTMQRDIDAQARDQCANAPDGQSADWITSIEADGLIEGGRSYHADVYRNGEHMCRIALTGKFDDAVAQQTLKARAREWIAEFEAR